MADETPHLPITPDLFSIPLSLIEEWGKVPQHERVSASLTRQDIDHLLVGLLRILDAQTALDQTIVDWSNGRLDDAQRSIAQFRKINADAQNSVRQLAAALMASILQGRQHG